MRGDYVPASKASLLVNRSFKPGVSALFVVAMSKLMFVSLYKISFQSFSLVQLLQQDDVNLCTYKCKMVVQGEIENV